MKPFYLKVVASNKVFFEGMATSLTVPIDDGSVGVLADHANTVMVIASGEIGIKTESGEEIHGFVGDGFIEIPSVSALPGYEEEEEVLYLTTFNGEDRALLLCTCCKQQWENEIE